MWETSTTVGVAGRSIMTLTGPRRSFPALLRHLDGSTPRRRLFRRATAAVVQTPLFRLFVDRGAPPPSAATLDLLEQVERDRVAAAPPTAAMAVVHGVSSWPGRSYVVALDEADRPRYFAKVSDQVDDGPRFTREHDVLDALRSTPLIGWNTPRSHGVAIGDGVVALVTECLPDGSENLTGPEVLTRLPLRRAGAQSVVERDRSELDWLDDALDRPLSDAFASLVDRALEAPIATSFVHGDIGTRNAFRVHGGSPWLLDWELASPCGPRATDLVVGELNITLDDVDVPLAGLWSRLSAFASAHNLTRQELALALLYLADRGHHRATLLVSSLESTTP
jgi:hypothetical protein